VALLEEGASSLLELLVLDIDAPPLLLNLVARLPAFGVLLAQPAAARE